MDVRLLIKQRLEGLGLTQKDLAAAAGVTESYISQIMTRRKPLPAPDQSDLYTRMAKLLKLPVSRFSKRADVQRKEDLKRKLGDPAAPLFKEIRELILRRCSPADEKQIRTIFEKQPFGELERLVTQKLLDVAKQLAKEKLENEDWLTTKPKGSASFPRFGATDGIRLTRRCDQGRSSATSEARPPTRKDRPRCFELRRYSPFWHS